MYHSETKPLLDYYADKLVPIDGVGTVDEVQQRALAALGVASRDSGDTPGQHELLEGRSEEAVGRQEGPGVDSSPR